MRFWALLFFMNQFPPCLSGRGPGETDSWKKLEAENLVSDSHAQETRCQYTTNKHCPQAKKQTEDVKSLWYRQGWKAYFVFFSKAGKFIPAIVALFLHLRTWQNLYIFETKKVCSNVCLIFHSFLKSLWFKMFCIFF